MIRSVYEVYSIDEEGTYGATIGVYLTREDADMVVGNNPYYRAKIRKSVLLEDDIYLLNDKAKPFSVNASIQQASLAAAVLRKELFAKLSPIERKIVNLEETNE